MITWCLSHSLYLNVNVCINITVYDLNTCTNWLRGVRQQVWREWLYLNLVVLFYGVVITAALFLFHCHILLFGWQWGVTKEYNNEANVHLPSSSRILPLVFNLWTSTFSIRGNTFDVFNEAAFCLRKLWICKKEMAVGRAVIIYIITGRPATFAGTCVGKCTAQLSTISAPTSHNLCVTWQGVASQMARLCIIESTLRMKALNRRLEIL